jgi:glycosyltransferase involved in cell wall biosynthesis
MVSPFLDRNHGTELLVAGWIEHLADKFEVHVYSQEVRDIDPDKFVWHRIPKLPGPHLFNYAWWFVANQLWRAFDRHFRGMRYDLVFSPGINCFDADVISVHVVFAQYLERNAQSARLAGHRFRESPRMMHRWLYYRLIIFLERRIYTRPGATLILMARRTSRQLARFYGRSDRFPVVYAGLDHEKFNPQKRSGLRAKARKELKIAENSFVLVLIGNDWRNKGVPVLLEALAQLDAPAVELLVVSEEEPRRFHTMLRERNLEGRVHLLPPRADVESYYAAADAYAGPSLEDSFAIPVAEAMACGLPVIVSAAAGVSEIVSHGVDGLILENPNDAVELAAMIRRLYEDAGLRSALGENAARTVRQYTWDRSGQEMKAIFEQVLRRKASPFTETVAQDL